MPNRVLVRSVSSTEQRLNDLRARKARSEAGGGQARIDAQHNRGKMTARERLDMLLDEGTFQEIDALVEHRCRDFDMDSLFFLLTGSSDSWEILRTPAKKTKQKKTAKNKQQKEKTSFFLLVLSSFLFVCLFCVSDGKLGLLGDPQDSSSKNKTRKKR